MTDKWTILDGNGSAIEIGDCVERGEMKYSVVGLTRICNEDVVVLGELVGDELAAPYCEKATWLRKIA